jgi:heptosyltransferase I
LTAQAHSPQPTRIVLLRLSSLGDCLHALPVFHRLRAALPQARLAWLVERRFSAALEGLPGLDELILFERHQGLTGVWACWRDLRRFRADWLLDLQGNGKSQLLAAGSGARWRFGAAQADRAEPWPRLSPRWRVAAASKATRTPTHAIDRGLALLAAWFEQIGLTAVPQAEPRLDLGLSPAERDAGRAAWMSLGPLADGGWIVQLAARPDPRSLPARAWLELLRQAQADRRPLLVSHGPAEAALVAELERELGPLPRLPGTLPVRHLAALFAAARERGFRFLGCDRGPLHLAASVGLPAVVLHGPTDPGRTGPYPPPGRAGSPHRALTSPRELSCRPCLARRCRLPGGPACLDELVMHNLLEQLDRPAP